MLNPYLARISARHNGIALRESALHYQCRDWNFELLDHDTPYGSCAITRRKAPLGQLSHRCRGELKPKTELLDASFERGNLLANNSLGIALAQRSKEYNLIDAVDKLGCKGALDGSAVLRLGGGG